MDITCVGCIRTGSQSPNIHHQYATLMSPNKGETDVNKWLSVFACWMTGEVVTGCCKVRSHRGLELILLTWPGGVISSDSLSFLMSLYVYYALTLGTYSNPILVQLDNSPFWHECVLLPQRVSGMVSYKCAYAHLTTKVKFLGVLKTMQRIQN